MSVIFEVSFLRLLCVVLVLCCYSLFCFVSYVFYSLLTAVCPGCSLLLRCSLCAGSVCVFFDVSCVCFVFGCCLHCFCVLLFRGFVIFSLPLFVRIVSCFVGDMFLFVGFGCFVLEASSLYCLLFVVFVLLFARVDVCCVVFSLPVFVLGASICCRVFVC